MSTIPSTGVEPTIGASHDHFSIRFPSDGPIVTQQSGGRAERVRITSISSNVSKGTIGFGRLSGAGHIIKQDGTDGLAKRSGVTVRPTDLAPGLLIRALREVQAKAEQHAADVAEMAERMVSEG